MEIVRPLRLYGSIPAEIQRNIFLALHGGHHGENGIITSWLAWNQPIVGKSRHIMETGIVASQKIVESSNTTPSVQTSAGMPSTSIPFLYCGEHLFAAHVTLIHWSRAPERVHQIRPDFASFLPKVTIFLSKIILLITVSRQAQLRAVSTLQRSLHERIALGKGATTDIARSVKLRAFTAPLSSISARGLIRKKRDCLKFKRCAA